MNRSSQFFAMIGLACAVTFIVILTFSRSERSEWALNDGYGVSMRSASSAQTSGSFRAADTSSDDARQNDGVGVAADPAH